MSKADIGSQQRLLFLLLAALVLVVGWQYLPGFFDGRGGIDGSGSDGSRQSTSLAGLSLVEPNIAALEAQTSQYEPGRNIFGYAAKPTPPPPKPPPPKPPPPVVRTSAPAPREIKPTPPPVNLDLLGLFGPEKRRIAVLDDGTNLLNVVEDDVIEDKFIIHHIGYESVDLKFVDFPDAKPHRLVIGG